MTPELFIGITSWDSALFLPHCLEAIRATTAGVATEVVVLDNCSEDGCVDIARDFGATVLEDRCSQAEALNQLVARSRARYTLLMHSDVILLDQNWFNVCRDKLTDSVVLISPEDKGCGPLTRPFGIGKPESSFLLFNNRALQRLRSIHWRRRGRLRVPQRTVDFYGDHVTHKLPFLLARLGLNWFPMAVHWSDRVDNAIFKLVDGSRVWSEELSFLRYGLGNFYSVNGIVTHYHNWYDRVSGQGHSGFDANRNKKDYFPLDYIRAYTLAFLSDLKAGRVVVPRPSVSDRKPVAL
jgi:glycosyltransferase involved in cell wall biosynthesis